MTKLFLKQQTKTSGSWFCWSTNHSGLRLTAFFFSKTNRVFHAYPKYNFCTDTGYVCWDRHFDFMCINGSNCLTMDIVQDQAHTHGDHRTGHLNKGLELEW